MHQTGGYGQQVEDQPNSCHPLGRVHIAYDLPCEEGSEPGIAERESSCDDRTEHPPHSGKFA